MLLFGSALHIICENRYRFCLIKATLSQCQGIDIYLSYSMWLCKGGGCRSEQLRMSPFCPCRIIILCHQIGIYIDIGSYVAGLRHFFGVTEKRIDEMM